MQCMLSLKSNLTQAIRLLRILAGSYLLLKRLIDGFCHRFANFDGLEGRQLWFNPCHYWPAYKDDSLRASQGYYQYSKPCKRHYQCSGEALWSPKLDQHQSRVSFHLKILVIAMLFPQHQAETFYRLLPINKRSDQKAK